MKNIIQLSLCTLLLLNLAAENIDDVLITGSMLFVQPAEPCEVYLDGTPMGEAPLFIQSVSRWNSKIQLKGKSSYAEAVIQFNPEKRTVTRYAPELEAYFGYLDIDSSEPDVTVIINGTASVSKGKSKQKEGTYTVRIEKEGFFTEERSVEVKRLETTKVSVTLNPAVMVSFDPELPYDSLVTFQGRKNGTVLELSTPFSEKIFLAAGIWDIRIENPRFETIETETTIAAEQALVAVHPNFYQPGIRLAQLKKQSTVYLNGKEITVEPESGVIPSSVGTNKLEVHLKGYLAIRKEIELSGNEITDVSLEYTKDPMFVKTQNKKKSIVLLGSGLTLLAGGLALNMDALLIPNSPDYETYSMLKYATLGMAGAGAATMLVGSGYALPIIVDSIQ